ncbi:hypothetical protein B0O99DRAFT_624582 [Bisporella sp. PMI_857]|nr:hypothetical protein B0O99DRAFT_624582 [Bisporella sp. PMI_857]
MSKSSFFSRTSSRAQNPILPQHNGNISLSDLSSHSSTRSQPASPSPPPSFYRNLSEIPTHNYSPSLSPSRTKASNRHIQFSGPPPPIATSALLNPTSAVHAPTLDGVGHLPIRRASRGADPLVNLERRERAIQQELQVLLDAQSSGLVHGFGGDVNDRVSDAGSSTPTASTRETRSRGVTPVRQPRKKAIGLKAARRGLGRDMGELIRVKDEESGVLEKEIERREEVLGKVKLWEERIEEMRAQLNNYAEIGKQSRTQEDLETAELQAEEKAVEHEIREMEDRLAQMKARKKWLGERIKEGVNRREARLSSYKGALKEVESEIKEFLKRPPLETSVVMRDEESFTALPANRRTLGMANEWWTREIEGLEKRKAEAFGEKEALKEGQKIWEETVEIVTEFEDDLRAQVKLNTIHGLDMLKGQIAEMAKVVGALEEKLNLAEKKAWNLLICAIGAELAAFREGQEILKGTLETLNAQHESDLEREETFHSMDDGFGSLKDSGPKTPNVQVTGQKAGNGKQKSTLVEDSEDDGPDLATLLVEKTSDSEE